jgi:hypothetical protein
MIVAAKLIGLTLMVAGTLGIWFLLGWCALQIAVGL